MQEKMGPRTRLLNSKGMHTFSMPVFHSNVIGLIVIFKSIDTINYSLFLNFPKLGAFLNSTHCKKTNIYLYKRKNKCHAFVRFYFCSLQFLMTVMNEKNCITVYDIGRQITWKIPLYRIDWIFVLNNISRLKFLITYLLA